MILIDIKLSLFISFHFSESLPVDVVQYVKDRGKLTNGEKSSVLQLEKTQGFRQFSVFKD